MERKKDASKSNSLRFIALTLLLLSLCIIIGPGWVFSQGPPIYSEIIFRFSDGGTLELNGLTLQNGSSLFYATGETLTVSAIPDGSHVFDHFADTLFGSVTSNPYVFNVTNTDTITAYFAQSHPIIVDSNIFFGFNNGWMNFATQQGFMTIYETSSNFWYFDLNGISIDGANATVLSWFRNNEVLLNLTAIPGYNVTVDMKTIPTNLQPTVNASQWTWTQSTGSLNMTEHSGFTTGLLMIGISPIYIPTISISEFTILQNVPFFVNATVYDELGITAITSFTLEFSTTYQIQVSWSQGTWNLATTNAIVLTSGCVHNDTYSEIFSFEIEMTGSTSETSVNLINAGTIALDEYGNTATWPLTEPVTLGTYIGSQGPSGPGSGPTNSTSPSNPTNSTTPNNPSSGTQQNNTAPQIPQNPILPQIAPIIAQIPFSPIYLMFGIIAIGIVVAITGYYSGSRKNPLKDAQKEWQKQRKHKNPKWNKDQD